MLHHFSFFFFKKKELKKPYFDTCQLFFKKKKVKKIKNDLKKTRADTWHTVNIVNDALMKMTKLKQIFKK